MRRPAWFLNRRRSWDAIPPVTLKDKEITGGTGQIRKQYSPLELTITQYTAEQPFSEESLQYRWRQKDRKRYDTIFRILNPKSRDLNSRLGGCGIRVINSNFFRRCSEFQMEIWKTQKTELILSLIFQVNLRLGGYSICNASTSCTIYVKEKFRAGATS